MFFGLVLLTKESVFNVVLDDVFQVENKNITEVRSPFKLFLRRKIINAFFAEKFSQEFQIVFQKNLFLVSLIIYRESSKVSFKSVAECDKRVLKEKKTLSTSFPFLTKFLRT